MTQISKVFIKQLPDMHMISLRKNINFFEEYSNFMEQALIEIELVLAANNLLPSSGPITCFHNVDLESLDVEIGMQVPYSVESTLPLSCYVLPSSKVAMAIDLGPYVEQDPTMLALSQWIIENNYEANGGIYYHYLNDEDQPEKYLLTQMIIPVVEKK